MDLAPQPDSPTLPDSRRHAWQLRDAMPGNIDFSLLGTLATKAQEGDSAAYETLLEQLYTYVHRVLTARVGRSADLDDLTQECLVGMHKSLPSYHPSRNIKPWIHAIIRYKLADHFRAIGRRKEFPIGETMEDIAETSPSDGVEIDGVEVRSIVNELPSPLCRAVVLTKFDGLSCEQAAEREGIAAAALRKRLSRAYKRLAGMLEARMEDDHGR